MPAKGRVWSCPRQSDIADVAGLAGRRIALKGPAFQLLALYALLDEAGRRLVNIYTTPIGQLNSTIWASPRMLAEEPELVRAAVAMQRDAANHLTPGGTNDPEVWRDLVVNQFGLEEPIYRELITNTGAVWELSDFWIDQAKAAGAKMAGLGLLQAEPDYDDLIRTEYQPA